jgi:hypothetical protein
MAAGSDILTKTAQYIHDFCYEARPETKPATHPADGSHIKLDNQNEAFPGRNQRLAQRLAGRWPDSRLFLLPTNTTFFLISRSHGPHGPAGVCWRALEATMTRIIFYYTLNDHQRTPSALSRSPPVSPGPAPDLRAQLLPFLPAVGRRRRPWAPCLPAGATERRKYHQTSDESKLSW